MFQRTINSGINNLFLPKYIHMAIKTVYISIIEIIYDCCRILERVLEILFCVFFFPLLHYLAFICQSK